jgi:hypothetical protein
VLNFNPYSNDFALKPKEPQQTTFDLTASGHHPLAQISKNTMSNSSLSAPTNQIRQELILYKRQVSEMRSNNMALKNEKLKAEHERNLVEIKAR